MARMRLIVVDATARYGASIEVADAERFLEEHKPCEQCNDAACKLARAIRDAIKQLDGKA